MIFIDFETRSKAVIQKTGAWRYAEDPSTEVLCMAYAIDSRPVQIWYPGEGYPFQKMPGAFIEAHHSFFERAIWRNIMVPKFGWPDIPDDRWRCSAALACYYALPRALDQLGAALNLPHKKDQFGKRIMQKLSRPVKARGEEDYSEFTNWSDSAEDFKVLYQYCMDDVAAERDIHTRLRPLPAQEQAIWALDQRINERGIRVDLPAVRAALRLLEAQESALLGEFKALTGLDSPRQVAELLKWLTAQGVALKSLNKAAVVAALATKPPAAVRRVLEIRQALAKSSTAKYQAIMNCVCQDGRLRGLLMYHGASTGRWTGQLVQPQNLPRNTFKGDLDRYFAWMRNATPEEFELFYPTAETLSSTIRGVFIPSEGHVFVGGDYNAIEARVLFWLASENHGLRMFRENQDIYKDMAATVYNTPVAQVTKQQRELGKRVILGCLAEDTLVYSDTGIKYIQDIKPTDKLWDGEEWVEHSGLLKTGLKPVIKIEYLGIELTPDHLVLTPKGWQSAEEIALFADTKLLKSVKNLASGKLSGRNYVREARGMSLFAANANLCRVLESINCGGDALRLVCDALSLEMVSSEETQKGIPILSLIHALEDDGSPLSTTLKKGARTRKTKTSTGMVLEAFESPSGLAENSWNMLLHYLGGTSGIPHSIELIIPEDMNAVISDWLRRRKTIKTKLKPCFDLLNAGPRYRFKVKNALVHNCGYGMGAEKFLETCKAAGITLDPDTAQRVIQAYRTKYRTVAVLWQLQEVAARQAIETLKPVRCGKVLWAVHEGFLFCRLPSGRCLAYYDPKIEMVETSWGEKRAGITFMGMNSVSRQWERQNTYGGKIVENITQAVARDIMANAMLNCEKAGFKVVLTVHDELLTESTVGQIGSAVLKNHFEQIMTTLPEWAAGLPVRAEGWVGRRYSK